MRRRARQNFDLVEKVARRLGRADAMQAPEPLLPSYGAANTRPFRQDINMLIQVNGKERTLDEFIELG